METETWKKIAGWVVKYIRNELTMEDRALLEAWLKKSKANQDEFDRLCSEEFLREQRKSELSFSADYAFQRFTQSMRKKRRISKLKIGGQIAAVIVLGLSVGWFAWRNPVMPEITSVEITSGMPMARLTLGDGKVVELRGRINEMIRQSGATVNITGEQVIYSGTREDGKAELNMLEVPRRGEFRLTLADGTKVWLNSETRLRFPQVFSGKNREVYLSGEAYFEVTADSLHPFIVNLPDAGQVEVLGTAFNICDYEDEPQSRTTLVHGRVDVRWEGKSLSLYPDEQAFVDLTTRQLKKQKVNVRPYIAWKEGRFVFRKQRLEDIMRTVERWYDVGVSYGDEGIRDITFSGNIERYENFGKIVEMLEVTGMVEFQVEGNQIRISRK